MFDHLLESSHRDDYSKWSNIGFVDEIIQVEFIEIDFTHLNLIAVYTVGLNPDEKLSNLPSYLDPSCLTLSQYF